MLSVFVRFFPSDEKVSKKYCISAVVVIQAFSMKSTGKRGAGKCLNDIERLEIISKLQRSNPPSKQAIARESTTLVRVLLESCGINVNWFYNKLKRFLIHHELLYFA